ncbi:caspase family protein [Rubrimonas cliftonensis]|uniref:Caspase domain-containing protein n=1 Tax=Rubrimonas cliftonensis TaxID=89524 RepID=A0A1H4G4I2_9RHOB|nr:caspase family protein [Rubrimonas cliftonensis]SEB04464.1 Caspase domain-containing protein [Rubrimonas cliftonensis]
MLATRIGLVAAMRLLVGAFALSSCAQTPAESPASNAEIGAGSPRTALVIGNGGYAGLPTLANPATDVRAVAAALSAAGYAVHGGGPQLDLTREAMSAAVDGFADVAARRGGVALVYFAGHGVQLSGDNYLMPTDARVLRAEDISQQAVALQDVLSALDETGILARIVVLDACRDNPFAIAAEGPGQRSRAVEGGASDVRSLSAGLSQLVAPPGSLVAFSTAPGAVALDGPPGGASPFASAFAEAMSRPGMRVEDVFIAVRNIVRARTGGAQTPWETSSLVAATSFGGAAAEAVSTAWDGRYEVREECGPAGDSPGFESTYWLDVIGGRAQRTQPDGREDTSYEIDREGKMRVRGWYVWDARKPIDLSGDMTRGQSRITGTRGPRQCALTMRYVSSESADRQGMPLGLPGAARRVSGAALEALARNATFVSASQSFGAYFAADGRGVMVRKAGETEISREAFTWRVGEDRLCHDVWRECAAIFSDGRTHYWINADNSLGWTFRVAHGDRLHNLRLK